MAGPDVSGARFILPAETDHHAGTIMTWPTKHSVFTPDWPYAGANLTQVRDEIASLARAVAKYEPVQMFVRDPKSYPDNRNDACGYKAAHELLGGHPNVTLHISRNVDSLWSRDNGALYARTADGTPVSNSWGRTDDPGVGFSLKNTSSAVVGLVLSFSQWGRKLPPSPESYIAAAAAQTLGVSSVLAPFVGEGGAIEVDGEGTLLATESSLLNPNRNPGISKQQMEQYMLEVFGVTKPLWIPGFRGDDITDDHVDSLARFGGLTSAGERVVLLDRYYVPPNSSTKLDREINQDYYDWVELLESSTDAKERKFKTIVVQEPQPRKVLGKDFHPGGGPSVSYVNFHVVNGGVVMSKFGDDELDDAAAKIIGEQFPGRTIEQVYTHQIAVQGGGIHCSTQQYYL